MPYNLSKIQKNSEFRDTSDSMSFGKETVDLYFKCVCGVFTQHRLWGFFVL